MNNYRHAHLLGIIRDMGWIPNVLQRSIEYIKKRSWGIMYSAQGAKQERKRGRKTGKKEEEREKRV